MKKDSNMLAQKKPPPELPKRKISRWRVARLYILFFCLVGIIGLAAFIIVCRVMMHLGILQ